LSNPVNINIPFREAGYFSPETPTAVGLRFTAKRGERINISIDKRPVAGFPLFLELWSAGTANEQARLIEDLDTGKLAIVYDAIKDGSFILRLQPELLTGGEYTLTIRYGPSLAFPVQASRPNISSFWGAPRDGGSRKHEGVDIAAAKGTPLLAAAAGRVTRVEETKVGGKVVWLRPDDRDYTLYYAHLDEQRVRPGQQVREGEIIGTVGNTGNARTTGPHLHFGIYAPGGAIDPLFFIQPLRTVVPAISADTGLISKMARTALATKVFVAPEINSASVPVEKHTPFSIESALGGWYRVRLVDGKMGFVQEDKVQPLTLLKKAKVSVQQSLLDFPSLNAARKMFVEKGSTVEIFAVSGEFSYGRYKDTFGWIII
jgi:murein DD-endopeptidase MepM/ murein hydrolase activator NlpD